MAIVKDLMTLNPITLDTSMTVEQVVELFVQNTISSAPVYSNMGEVIGQLTEMGLVRALLAHQAHAGKYDVLARCTEFFEDAVFVESTDSMTTLMRSMMKSASRRVLVKGEGRKKIGIVSPKDMLRVIGRVKVGGEKPPQT